MLSESHSDADDDDDTEARSDDNRQHQNDDDTSDDAGTPTTVSADAAVDFCKVCLVIHRAGAVRSSTLLSRVSTKCTTKDAAVIFSARLSSYQHVTASVY